MTEIGRGDWLLCVNGGKGPGETAGVTAGRVYCVERMEAVDGPCLACGKHDLGFQLVDVPLLYGTWCHCGFTPLGGGREKVAPPARVCEPA